MKNENMKIDKIDKQLLYWLDLNCRDSLGSLAKKMRTTPAKVNYRMARLVENNAITSFVTLVDYRKFGMAGCSIYFKLKEMGNEELKQVVEKIKLITRVVDLVLTTGAYDMQIVLLIKTPDDASDGLWSIREILEQNILEESIVLYLRTHFFSRENFLDKKNQSDNEKPRLVFRSHEKIVDIDPIDHKILTAMAERADFPIWKIAKHVGIPGPTVYSRIKKMERDKIIIGYSAKINPNLKGYHLYRVLVKLRRTPHSKRERILGFLDSHPLIYRSTFTFGAYDFTYDARVDDDSELRKLLVQVYENFSDEVIRQDWIRVYEIIKFGFYISDKK